MSATTETAVIFLGVDTLVWPALIAARILRTTDRRRRDSGVRLSTLMLPDDAKQPRAEVAADTTPATPAPVHAEPIQLAPRKEPRPAVARSKNNPGLAAFAARRPRAPGGHFLPMDGNAS